MIGIIKKVTTVARNRTTYKIGLLQTKAYRILKQHTNKALLPHEMTSVHWGFLGLLNDSKEGIRSGDAAQELGVEAPFVTALFAELKKKNLVETTADPKDSRAKILCLTPKGIKFVEETEEYLRKEMKSLLKDVSINELMAYLVVLEKIIENAQ